MNVFFIGRDRSIGTATFTNGLDHDSIHRWFIHVLLPGPLEIQRESDFKCSNIRVGVKSRKSAIALSDLWQTQKTQVDSSVAFVHRLTPERMPLLPTFPILELATPDVIHHVYQQLIDTLPRPNAAQTGDLARRGLTSEEQVKFEYREFPGNLKKLNLAKQLLKRFGDRVFGVRGFIIQHQQADGQERADELYPEPQAPKLTLNDVTKKYTKKPNGMFPTDGPDPKTDAARM
jgi:hypothetical protein